MTMQKSRARVPARISVQVTQELKGRLQELAQREYGGDLQRLLRETLQARLDEPGDGMGEISEVLRTLEQTRQEAAERNRETGAQMERLLDTAAQLSSTLNLQVSDTKDVRDKVEKVLRELSDLNNRTHRLEQGWRDRSGSEGDC